MQKAIFFKFKYFLSKFPKPNDGTYPYLVTAVVVLIRVWGYENDMW